MAYTGPAGIGIFTNNINPWTRSSAIENPATQPWVDIWRSWNRWQDFEPTYNHYDWSTTIQACKDALDNGYSLILALSTGIDAPSWLYGPNGIADSGVDYAGNGSHGVVRVDYEDEGTPGTVNPIPLPWDANLRWHWQRMCDSVKTMLDTTYVVGGVTKHLYDAIIFVTVSMSATNGTEMSMGTQGNPNNTAAFNAVEPLGIDKWTILNETAWKQSFYDAVTRITNAMVCVAFGINFNAGYDTAINLTNYAANQETFLTTPKGTSAAGPTHTFTTAEKARTMFMTTNLQVDFPGAVSYAAWSGSAATSIQNARNKGFTTGHQSGGIKVFHTTSGELRNNSTWNAGGGVGTAGVLGAIKKAYMDEGTVKYQAVFIETNFNILQDSQIPGTQGMDWASTTLRTAVQANASSGGGGGGGISVPVTVATGTSADVITVPTAGTRVQGPTFTCNSVVVVYDGPTGVGVVGDSTVRAATGNNHGTKLKPGQLVNLGVTNLNQLYFDTTVNGSAFKLLIDT